jgi:hypothetical protein
MAIFKSVKRVYNYRDGGAVFLLEDGTAIVYDGRRNQMATFEKADEAFNYMKTGQMPLSRPAPVATVSTPVTKPQTSAIPSDKSGVGAKATGDLIPLM